jgi:hypothetical protein
VGAIVTRLRPLLSNAPAWQLSAALQTAKPPAVQSNRQLCLSPYAPSSRPAQKGTVGYSNRAHNVERLCSPAIRSETGGHARSDRGPESTHQHGPDCGQQAVPQHIDYLVDGDHCDDHGPLSVVSHRGNRSNLTPPRDFAENIIERSDLWSLIITAQEGREKRASVPHCLLLPSKRIGRTKVRSVSGTAAGGGGNGAARVSKESASASSTDEPELLMISLFST